MLPHTLEPPERAASPDPVGNAAALVEVRKAYADRLEAAAEAASKTTKKAIKKKLKKEPE